MEYEEALAWLKANKNKCCFASNAFDRKADVVAFVEKLYAAGAEHVSVDNIMDEDAGEYADALLIKHPNPKDEGFVKLVESAHPDEITKSYGRVLLWWD